MALPHPILKWPFARFFVVYMADSTTSNITSDALRFSWLRYFGVIICEMLQSSLVMRSDGPLLRWYCFDITIDYNVSSSYTAVCRHYESHCVTADYIRGLLPQDAMGNASSWVNASIAIATSEHVNVTVRLGCCLGLLCVPHTSGELSETTHRIVRKCEPMRTFWILLHSCG